MRIVSCPICRKEAPWEKNPFRPFCGNDCRQKDLGKWATESYRFVGEDAATLDEKKQSEEE